MKLVQVTTGSNVPKRLGCYEQELRSLIDSWSGCDRVIDIGCGEGCYAVGLARRMPVAEVRVFDISPAARNACARAATVHGVSIHILPTLTAPGQQPALCEARTRGNRSLWPATVP